ncbi:GAF domain-containing protein [Sandaracinus amylolyticus]|uniref:GAF domain-containing protein n=1 Tax=Sandaracinus amylolyticus TaxID=927083 RepID=UPI001F1576DC|nr:GAF domain-containing protein [Sandaracinus amylolyticus]UJR86558.1 Hypothetical protein I5071_86590 [Sandaracinus amylolyticus]
MKPTIPLDRLSRCFQGIVPGAIATCDAGGLPNVSYVSHVQVVDDRHVALSCQFFNKTRRNLDQSPLACVQIVDPLTLQAYQMRLRFLRSEREGALFESMSARLDAIASHTGMKGVFKLLSSDVFEVLEIEVLADFLVGAEPPTSEHDEPMAIPGPAGELRALQTVSARINRACDLEALLASTLAALEELFGFGHTMVLVPDGSGKRLVTIASHGYGDGGIGAEVAIGDGLVGTVAEERRVLAVAGIDAGLRYGRAIRDATRRAPSQASVRPEIPLPGLPDARSQLGLPLLVEDRLLGVLAIESRDPAAFEPWHEAFLQVLANQIASRMDHLAEHEDDDEDDESPSARRPDPDRIRISLPGGDRTRVFCFYKNDDAVFVDGEYLIRNVPGKILWKLLNAHARERRTEYSNRELRLDPWLGLPAIKDNLESRLILLRKRLEQKCPEVRIVPTRRGRFALELECAVELVERETA